MGDPPGQQSQALELLCLLHRHLETQALLVGLLELGHVPHDGHALVVTRAYVPGLEVAGLTSHLQGVFQRDRFPGGQRLMYAGQTPLGRVDGQQVADVAADDLFRGGIQVGLLVREEVQEGPLAIEPEHHVRDGRQQCASPHFTALQRLDGPAACGDVVADDLDRLLTGLWILDHERVVIDPALLTLERPVSVLEAVHLTVAQHLVAERAGLGDVLEQRADIPADQVGRIVDLALQVQEPHGAAVDEQDRSVQPEPVDRDPGEIHRLLADRLQLLRRRSERMAFRQRPSFPTQPGPQILPWRAPGQQKIHPARHWINVHSVRTMAGPWPTVPSPCSTP